MSEERLFSQEGSLSYRRFDPERAAGESAVDLTPMIDVTILLLIFFMVTSAIASQVQVSLPQARHGRGIDPTVATSIVVLDSRDPSGLPVALLGDRGGSKITLEEVRAVVEQGLSEGRTRVVIKAHRLARWGDVSKVARAAGSVEGVDLYIGVREKE